MRSHDGRSLGARDVLRRALGHEGTDVGPACPAVCPEPLTRAGERCERPAGEAHSAHRIKPRASAVLGTIVPGSIWSDARAVDASL